MSSPTRRSLLRHPEVVDTGCSHGRSKLSVFFTCSSARPLKPPQKTTPFTSSAASSTSQSNFSLDAAATPHSSSFDDSPSPCPSRSPSPVILRANSRRGRSRVEKKGGVEESVEVVMETRNPYLDFRNSMMTMIVEKEIYAWDDLRELLRRFLSLNSPYHHLHILQAFSEALNHVRYPIAVTGESSVRRLKRRESGEYEDD